MLYLPISIQLRHAALVLAAAVILPASAHAGYKLKPQEAQIAEYLKSEAGQRREFLTLDPVLSRVARQRARDMAVRNYFNHVNPDGVGPNFLVGRAGYPLPDWWGSSRTANYIESISAGRDSPLATWQGWLGSPSHRNHVLGLTEFYASETSYGVGYAYSPTSRYKHYWVILTAPPRANSSNYVSRSVPARMQPGQTYSVGVTMRNTGSAVWTGLSHQLAAVRPRDNANWGRSSVAVGALVPPGETEEVVFQVTAPETPGTYDFGWMMREAGAEWFGEDTPAQFVTVGTPARGALFVSQSVPRTMKAGRVYPVQLTVRNAGSNTWVAGQRYALRPKQAKRWGVRAIPVPATVKPDEEVTFEFNVRAPARAGLYDFQCRMKQKKEKFGDLTALAQVSVR